MSDEYLRQVQAELKQFRSANTKNLKRIAELESQHAALRADFEAINNERHQLILTKHDLLANVGELETLLKQVRHEPEDGEDCEYLYTVADQEWKWMEKVNAAIAKLKQEDV